MTPGERMHEARRRLDVALFLFDAGHYPEAQARAFYAMVAGVDALLHQEGIQYGNYKCRNGELARLYAKAGRMTPSYPALFEDLLKRRMEIDYDAVPVFRQEAEAALDAVGAFVREAKALL